MVAYLPPKAEDEVPLWRIQHADGDREDLNAAELQEALLEGPCKFDNGSLVLPPVLQDELLELLQGTSFPTKTVNFGNRGGGQKPKPIPIQRLVLGYSRPILSTLPAFVSAETLPHLALYKLLRDLMVLFAPPRFRWTSVQVNLVSDAARAFIIYV